MTFTDGEEACEACAEKDKRIAALKKAVLSARHDADEAEARLEEALTSLSFSQRRARGE